ncbi:hypothetical protein AALT_g7926 [Alternaria alternata]|nr:hypothetical protein AALT_g7926 [Alternaria alternata]
MGSESRESATTLNAGASHLSTTQQHVEQPRRFDVTPLSPPIDRLLGDWGKHIRRDVENAESYKPTGTGARLHSLSEIPVRNMKSSKRIAPYKPPKELAQALGYSCISDAEPYLNYILQARTEKYDAKGYLSFIIHIIQHFTQKGLPPNSVPQSDTIRALLQKLEKDGFLQIFTDTASDPTKRKIEVEDHVMGILGRWTMLLDHFQSRGGVRSLVEESHNLAKLVGKSGLLASDGSHVLSTPANMQSEVVKTAISLVQLLSKLDSSTNNAAASGGPLQGSSIFSNSFVTHAPIMDMDLESLSISSESLNAFILHIDAAVDISWTLDLSRHMILTTANGRHKLEDCQAA